MSAGVAGDPRRFAPPAPAAHRPGTEATLLDGTLIADHWFGVPLDHADPAGRRITVFAREYVAAAHREHRHDLPWLLFLQGGPGGKGLRQSRLSGWMKEAAKDFRILMLDQRGTGLSTPATRHSIPTEGDARDQAEYLVHLRAPSIVQDAEMIRRALGSGPWTVFGQSFGGFCVLSYLSWHPAGVARALVTGGLAPLEGHAEDVYRATYERMRHRNEEFLARFPEDREGLARVYALARSGDARLPDGSPLTPGRVQALGMYLGGNTRMDQLHYLLQEAFEGPDRLSDAFLHGVYQQVSRAANPLYLVLHESIYAQPAELGAVRSDTGGTDTGWAAQRVLADSPGLAGFDPERSTAPLLTGEMVFDWYPRLDPALRPLAGVTEELARRTAWGPLYDPAVLAANTVPVAAAVYAHDVYVDRDLSLRTAAGVRGLAVWETDAFHHDGIGDDGPGILRRLLSLTA
ncbi:alpha/beta fold hydrolase [Citricoccus sp. SGAir0253]|uniref:alpha/beta fold hydrolase n=1 Tax=Citricoccus sp. SGAir0253 TaxID=2567881 RepID=UPI0010CCD32F|nr:alpha/beta fold hydrolase [Citricoccus sp. SGAir0253]QCU78133.1 alpha/beta fold hydrolase [Citricoccus sp. SGAir0253]